MQQSFLQGVLDRIERLLPAAASGSFCVALSGGRDSTALLHAMTSIVGERPQFRLRAVHVDHQLQSASAAWGRQCEAACAALSVPLVVERVAPDRRFPEGIEAAARQARYAALKRQLQPGEILLTAHHADDQLETVLLALVRGAGVGGLAAMPEIKPFAAGWHMRPLLECTRAEVEHWARGQGLAWIDDPTNESPRFDRNYLRSEVLPSLQRRWPSVARSVLRSAMHVGEARGLLDELADADLEHAAVGRCLDVRVLETLSAPRRGNLLRRWLARSGARMPSTRKLATLEHDILTAAADQAPSASWDDVDVRRHGDLLYCERAQPALDASLQLPWRTASPLQLPGTLGTLEFSASGNGLVSPGWPEELQVRFRQGGEKLQLPGRAHRSYLKNLLQDARVLPWWRDRLPLIYAQGQLAAVADLWTAAEFAADGMAPAIRIVWHGRPEIFVQPRNPPEQ